MEAERSSEKEELILDTLNQEERHLRDQNMNKIIATDLTGFYVLLCHNRLRELSRYSDWLCVNKLDKISHSQHYRTDSGVQLASHQVGFGLKGSECAAHHLLPYTSKVKKDSIRLPELEQKRIDNYAITFKILRLLTAVNSGKKLGYAPLLSATAWKYELSTIISRWHQYVIQAIQYSLS
jgi:hypothetical protein